MQVFQNSGEIVKESLGKEVILACHIINMGVPGYGSVSFLEGKVDFSGLSQWIKVLLGSDEREILGVTVVGLLVTGTRREWWRLMPCCAFYGQQYVGLSMVFRLVLVTPCLVIVMFWFAVAAVANSFLEVRYGRISEK